MTMVRLISYFRWLLIAIFVSFWLYFAVNIDISMLPSILPDNSPRTNIAFCLNVKDDIDVPEWIVYHHRLGVGKFYVFDNGSKPPLRSSLQRFIDLGIVHYEYTYGFDSLLSLFLNYFFGFLGEYRPVHKHLYLYTKCMKKLGHKHHWVAAIDNDEFIELKNKNESLSDFLKPFETYAGLRMGWKIYGSSGLLKRPAGGVLGHYNKCRMNPEKVDPGITPYKTLVQPKYSSGIGTIHDYLKLPGWFSVNEHFVRVEFKMTHADPVTVDDYVPLTYDKIWINHYQIKSKEDFEMKMKRGSGNSVKRNEKYFKEIDALATEDCPILSMPQKNSNLL